MSDRRLRGEFLLRAGCWQLTPDAWRSLETCSLASSSTSLTESIFEYRRIHGRPYTQKTDYYGPNDEKQNEGLDLQHYAKTLFFDNKLFLAPIGNNPQRVLDLGTGTGIWAIDFADEYPSAEVVGTDISPIQPSWVPTNCKFQIDDYDQMPWTWPANHFDFVHVGHLEGCVSDWPAFYEQALEVLKPGGWIEVKHWDVETYSQTNPDLPESHPFRQWPKLMFAALDKIGKTGSQHVDHGIARNLEAAGFVNVVEKRWPIPTGGWANDPKLREVGECQLEFLDQSLEGFGTFLLKEFHGWEYAEILVFMAEVRKAMKDPKLQPYLNLYANPRGWRAMPRTR
ncbi:putative SAM dependent methyltransferase [Colletotrichum sojae]|uniref:Putative SAM dependent methyltransferase n=1 Tax=Colletotrichum sojae TaxID=2175907 RepID=A0A8H6J3M3_9PEZI|nr:putative SAM dependent methyltransferase [Colletotrichum sojae]